MKTEPVANRCPKCQAPDQYGDSCDVCGAHYRPTELVNPYSALSGKTPVWKNSTGTPARTSRPCSPAPGRAALDTRKSGRFEGQQTIGMALKLRGPSPGPAEADDQALSAMRHIEKWKVVAGG